MNRFADDVVAAERERQIADAAADLHARTLFLDDPRRLDEVHRVVVVLLEPGRDGEDVGVEDDVGRIEVQLLGEQLVSTLADLHLARDSVGLPDLVEGHDDDAGAIALDGLGLLEEVLFPFLEADGVDDALALDALEPGFENGPLGAVDHHRHARDLGLGGDVVEEGRHGLLGIEHAFIHVHIDQICSTAHLI